MEAYAARPNDSGRNSGEKSCKNNVKDKERKYIFMVKSMYAAVAGLKSHQSKMDVISNNIANINTWGYKSKTINFQDAMYQNTTTGAGGNAANGGTGGVNTSQLGYGVNVGSISANYTTGSWNPTGDNLSCMINGSGFFIVGPMVGDPTDPAYAGVANNAIATSGLSLSKVGIFTIDNNGYLVDNQGNYVYGYQPKADGTFDTTALKPIQIPKDAAGDRIKMASYKIGTDGSIVGVDGDSKPHTIGQVAIASVENPNGLEQGEGYLYSVGANAGNVTGMVTTKATGNILSGYLEMSNVDLAKEMSDMITTQRGYQANSKIITVTDEMLEQLVNIKR